MHCPPPFSPCLFHSIPPILLPSQLQWLLDTNVTFRYEHVDATERRRSIYSALIDDYRALSDALSIIVKQEKNSNEQEPPLDCHHFKPVLHAALDSAGAFGHVRVYLFEIVCS